MKIFIGYDPTAKIAFDVCKFSIEKNTSKNVEILALIQSDLRNNNYYYRPIDDKGSTEFTFTRFLVPALTNYQGWAIFCDCDFLWVNDIQELISQKNNQYAVMVVKHDYNPSNNKKFNNNIQYQYPKKNWSSMILWNCSHEKNKNLTLDVVNTSSGEFLHQFKWLNDEDIGTINKKWNWLANWYVETDNEKPNAIHYTEGGPWIDLYKNCQYSKEWNKYKEDFNKINSI